MREQDDEIVKEFLVESQENLDQLDRDLVALESESGSDELLARVFRTVHTLKGTCGFLGYAKLEAVAHAGENLLSRLRDGRLDFDREIATTLLAMVDRIRLILGHIARERREGDEDAAPIIAALGARLVEAPGAAPPAPAATAAPSAPASGPRGTDVRLFDDLIASGGLDPLQLADAERQQKLGDPRRIGEILVERGALTPQQVLDALIAREQARRGGVFDANVRVDVMLLDRLMNLVGELVLARNQILQFVASGDHSRLPYTSQRLNLITSQLQDEVMRTRMQPVRNAFARIPRLVRELTAANGKRVRLEAEGEDTELDKTILEAIRDPLTHLVRNALDHGLEAPEIRAACGKDPEGLLRLRAYHQGGQVILEIEDDGAGLPIARIRRRAIERGLVPQDRVARMTDEDWIALIFVPGFSTAEQVTSVSGRGVGMDVVKSNVERIGGSIAIETRANVGTTVRVKIPLTLAIVPALVVSDGGERYAIPQVSLLELVRLEGPAGRARIESFHGAPVLRLRDALLPLAHLRALLATPPAARPDDALHVVVLQAEGRRFGLVVDHVHDSEEIVVKALDEGQRGGATFAGVTILGDGRVCLILDVPGLARRAGVPSAPAAATAVVVPEPESPAAALETLLLTRVRAGWPVAIPMAAVSRLEELPAAALERPGDREVIQYRGAILPLVRLAAALDPGAAPAPDGPTVRVVVLERGGERIGVVVDQVADIVEQAVDVQPLAGRPGVRGTAVVQGRVTDLVDLEAVARLADAPAGAGVRP